MERKSVTANKKLRCLQRKNPLLCSVEMFPYSVVLISIYLFNYPEVSACCPPPFLRGVGSTFCSRKTYTKKTWIAGWPPSTFLRLSLYWPSGRGGGGCNKKNLSGVFADEWGTESRWRSRGEKKRSCWCTFFRRRYAEDDVRTPPHSA